MSTGVGEQAGRERLQRVSGIPLGVTLVVVPQAGPLVVFRRRGLQRRVPGVPRGERLRSQIPQPSGSRTQHRCLFHWASRPRDHAVPIPGRRVQYAQRAPGAFGQRAESHRGSLWMQWPAAGTAELSPWAVEGSALGQRQLHLPLCLGWPAVTPTEEYLGQRRL